MSLHSQSAASYQAPATPEFPRHVVTAVLVAHDGARWLPRTLAGLLGQERPAQNHVAADTGSSDESARLLTEGLGDDRVLHLARRTGFGTAVEEAARTAGTLTPEDLPYLKRPSGWDPVSRTWRDDNYDLPELPHGEPVQWLWLLHDDSAPEPDALTELLRVAEENPDAAVIGPKLRGWYDKKQLLEAGVTIARSGRRWTGLDRREQDQGQHDQVRPVLSVSTAGMLIRRDVYEALGGFDRRLPLMRDDVDLCWRAQSAGHTVLVAPDAVMRHAEASARERRTVDCAGRTSASPHRVDKAAAVYTMLANSSGRALPYVLLRVLLGTALRTLAYLVGKAPGQAVDEFTGLLATLLRPGRILAARKARRRPAVPAGELRPLFPPPGASLRANAEQLAGYFGEARDTDAAPAGRHGGASILTAPGEDGDYPVAEERFARLKRIARNPAPALFAVLLLVSLAACRALIGGDSLMGGALLPAPDGGTDLWRAYTDGWHAVGTGSTASAPPYLAVIGALATLLFGSTKAALTLLLVGSVPLAGLTAYFASRPLVESRLLRAWAAVAYAFLPAVTGALAGGRLGTALLAVLLPLIARSAVAAFALDADEDDPEQRGSWRAVWTYTLLLTLATAFTPVVWPLAVVLGSAALTLRLLRSKAQWKAYGLRLFATLAVPVLVLAPWSLGLLRHPGRLLREAGLPYGTGSAGGLDLLGISPGGPGTGTGLLLIGVVLAALAALLRAERRFGVRAAWAVALTGLAFAVLVNRGGWAGPATLVYGLALLTAAVLGADGARERVAARSFGWRQPLAALIALTAAAGPLLAAAAWMVAGADGPLTRRDPVQVPAFVADAGGDDNQTRTLILDLDAPGRVSYSLVRGSGGRLGDAEITGASGGDPRLDKVVSNLVAGSGADQSSQLSAYAIRFVMFRPGGPEEIRRVLDATPGLSRRHQQDGTALWGVEPWLPRAVIVSAKQGEAPIPVAAGPVEVHGKIPDGEAGRVLRIADRADSGWQATLDGKPLSPKTLDGWAQGFELPASGGRLALVHESSLVRTAWHWTQGFLALVLLVMALPGRRASLDDDLPEEEAAASPAGPGEPGEGRRARRLCAEAEAAPAPLEAAAVADPYAQIPAQPVYGEETYAYQAYGDQGGYAYEPQQPQQPPQYEQQPPQPHQYDQYEQYEQYPPYDQGDQGGQGGQGGRPYEDPYTQQYPYPYEQQPYDPHAPHEPRPDGSPQQ